MGTVHRSGLLRPSYLDNFGDVPEGVDHLDAVVGGARVRAQRGGRTGEGHRRRADLPVALPARASLLLLLLWREIQIGRVRDEHVVEFLLLFLVALVLLAGVALVRLGRRKDFLRRARGSSGKC